MTCISIKQVYKRINIIAKTISSYLRPSTPNPISPELSILRLPQEVIDIIVDELGSRFTSNFNTHSIEFQTLQNCALISRSFRFRATRWVFFHVRFDSGRWRDTTWLHKRAEGFLKLLISNPSIGGSVRELFIKTSPRSIDFWIQDNPSLISILGRLSQIQRFDLRYGMQLINWQILPRNTATALRCTIQSPSITFLELHDIDGFPWSILAGCSTLKNLAISRVRASRRHVIIPPTVAPTLESLYITNAYSMSESLLSNLITVGVFSQLRILSVGFHLSGETRDAARFIIKVAQTLETLNVISLNDELMNSEDSLYQIDLSRLPALRHLNILRCTVEYHPMGTPQFPSSLCQLLKLRGSTSYIQTIVVHLEYEDVELGTEQGLFLPQHGWADFDAVLADENYRALEKATLNLAIGFIWWDPKLRSTHTERIKLLMDTLFPAVKASGRVEMDIVINVYGNPR